MVVRLKKIILVCFIFCAVGQACSEQPETWSATVQVGKWQQFNGYIQNEKYVPVWPFMSQGNLLVLNRTVDCRHDFHVKAKIVIIQKQGTAASFMIGSNNFLLDGASGMAMEGPDFGKVGVISNSSNIISAGKPFIFECLKTGDLLKFKIDGKKVGETVFKCRESLPLALRPMRTIMNCYEFIATGCPSYTFSDYNDKYFLQQSYEPTTFQPLCVKGDTTVNIPLSSPVESMHDLKLVIASVRDGNSIAMQLDGVLAADKMSINAKIPSSIKTTPFLKSEFSLVPVNFGIYSNKEKTGSLNACLYVNEAAGFPECKIGKIAGNTTILVNGKPLGTMQGCFAFRSLNLFERDAKDFAEVGVGQFKLLLNPNEFMRPDGSFDMDGFFNKVTSLCNRIILQAPDAHILFQLRLFVPKSWTLKNPDELIKFDPPLQKLQYTPDDSIQPSYASSLWRKTYGDILRSFVTRLSKSYLADRVIGIRLCYANCNEWNNWGYQYQVFPDFSTCMNIAFGEWLVKKYGSQANLQKAWRGAAADMQTVVPRKKQRLCTNPAQTFRYLPHDIPVADFYDFWQTFTVQTIEYFAKIIKEASEGKILCGAYYGYYVGHLGGAPYHFQDSGHYDVKAYLESPYLDFLGSPNLYTDREKYACLNNAFSSPGLHGKLLTIENDQRTERSSVGETPYGRTDNVEDTIAIFQRDFMNFYAKDSSYYYYDMSGDWYRSEKLMAEIKKLKEIEKLIYSVDAPADNQVAIFVSEESIPYYANNQNIAALLLLKMIAREIDFAGAPWDFYLMSDLDKVNFKQYKLVIFANAYHVPEQQQKLIREKVFSDDRNVVFLYASGMINENKFDAAGSKTLTGIDLKALLQEQVSKIELSDNSTNLNMITTAKFSPLVFSVDQSAKVLGYLNGDKSMPGAVEKKFSNCTVFWFGFPKLDLSWLKYLYKRAGVHIYTQRPDIFYKKGNFYCIYSRTPGRKAIQFKTTQEVVVDLLSKKIIGEQVDNISITMPSTAKTSIMYAGKMTPAVKNFIGCNVKKND